MHRKLLSLLALCLVTGCIPDAKVEPSTEVVDSNPLADVRVALELKAVTPVVPVGKQPVFSAELFNRSSKQITVVLPGDGSECGWRTPILTWNPPLKLGGRCGNINSLKTREVATLAPGQGLPLTEWIGAPILSRPGKHKVSLNMENKPEMVWKGIPLGEHDPAAMVKVRSSTPFKVVSNVVEVEIVPVKGPG
jgi:hypothetical protein